eukprot:GHVO01005895.1.p1 GENE.GHVO01005895.1~~GHVO01005895.1.p1  ORF type:complete len:281 (+),score=33.79 GHVO01005895.1:31-843(+)
MSGFTAAELAAAEWSKAQKRQRKNEKLKLRDTVSADLAREKSERRKRLDDILMSTKLPTAPKGPSNIMGIVLSAAAAAVPGRERSRSPTPSKSGGRRKGRRDRGSSDRGRHSSDSEDARKSKRTSRRRSKESRNGYESGSSDEGALDVPRDPTNPLDAAYDRKAYRERKLHKRSRKGHSRDSRKWDHDLFERRSVSPNRDRNVGDMWDTRTGEWKSRAGGVYLPPTEPRPTNIDAASYRYWDPKSRGRKAERDSDEERPRRRASPVYELD